MKTAIRKPKYQLNSGDQELLKASTIRQICDHIGCTDVHIYTQGKKDLNNDGSLSFNFRKLNYTIIRLAK